MNQIKPSTMRKELFSFFMTCREERFAAQLLLHVKEDGMIQLDSKLVFQLFQLHFGFIPGPGDEVDIDLVENPEDRKELFLNFNYN
jgi:hypothetical protein